VWFAYVLRSKIDGGFYIGMTSRLEARIREHNSGANRSTKARAPFVLAYVERFDSRSSARTREKYLKSGIGREFLKGVAAEELNREAGK
jgi:putative endonuclease